MYRTVLLFTIVLVGETVSVAGYSITQVSDERQLYLNDFHFATLIADAQGRLIFRPHPDQDDVNAWGGSWYTNPFLAGGEPGYGVIDTIAATASGIDITLHGDVARSSGLTYGTWQLQGSIGYDPIGQRVFGSGTLNIALAGTLMNAGADLNLERLADSFLHNVPLQTGGTGDTGDMGPPDVKYSPTGDPRDFVWYPPALPAHFPQDFSNFIEITAIGQINTVDTLALGEGFQIAIARKPTLRLSYSSTSAAMIAGLIWNPLQGQNFAADNVGMNHLIPQGSTANTNFELSFQFEATRPDLPGDFDDDYDVDASDIDILWHILRGSGSDPGNNDSADLNSSGSANEDDVDYLLNILVKLSTNNPPPGITYGDANLSGGSPELTDYNLWRTGTGGWANGDFDGSGGVPELNDYNLWRTGPTQFPGTIGEHGGQGSPLVPEPATIVLMGLALPALLVASRRRIKLSL